MTPFATAIADYVANIKTTAEAGPVRQAPLKEFNAAVEQYLNAATGHGDDWGVTERAQLWADVAQVEADYKVDGREG